MSKGSKQRPYDQEGEADYMWEKLSGKLARNVYQYIGTKRRFHSAADEFHTRWYPDRFPNPMMKIEEETFEEWKARKEAE